MSENDEKEEEHVDTEQKNIGRSRRGYDCRRGGANPRLLDMLIVGYKYTITDKIIYLPHPGMGSELLKHNLAATNTYPMQVENNGQTNLLTLLSSSPNRIWSLSGQPPYLYDRYAATYSLNVTLHYARCTENFVFQN